ncbi:MAG: hypothetical protein IJS45_03375 [Clostridia bacterium]|nr:hypothetical protein [Clostridia bacterium]
MPRKKHETHLWFGQGDDVIEVESFDAKLNVLIGKLASDVPDAVCVYSDEDGCLRCSVPHRNLTFRTIRPLSAEIRKARSLNGKHHAMNFKHRKSAGE